MKIIQMDQWWRVLMTGLLLVVATVPGTLVTPFDGLPLSPGEALAVFGSVVLIWTTHEWMRQKIRRWLLTCVLLLIILNLVGWWLLPQGWSVCLRRLEAAETLVTPCESSVGYRDGSRTFVFSDISFTAEQFPLYFMNDVKAFNFHKDNEPSRNSLRYSMQGETFFPRHSGAVIINTNLPEVDLTFNGHHYTVGPDEALLLSLDSAAVNSLAFFYATDRSDADAITIEAPIPSYYRLIAGGFPPRFLVSLYALLQWLGLLVIAAIFTTSLWRRVKSTSRVDVLWLVYALVVVLMYWLSASAEPVMLATTVVAIVWLLARLSPRGWRYLLVLVLLVPVLLAGIYVQNLLPYGNVSLLGGGDDPLTYEGYAREVALAPSMDVVLAGGEDGLFYYQPLYRYGLAFMHIVVGEGLWGPYVIQLSLSLLALLLYGRFFYQQGGDAGLILVGVLLLYFVSHGEVSFITLATSVYQEALAWPLFFLALLLLLVFWQKHETGWWPHWWLGLLWGIALFTRTDLLPSLMAVGVYLYGFWWYRSGAVGRIGKIAGGFFGGFVVVPLAVFLRNFLVAGQVSFLPTSGYVNLLEPFKKSLPHVTPESFNLSVLLWDIPRAYVRQLDELLLVLFTPYQSYFWQGETLRLEIMLGLALLLLVTIFILWRPGQVGRVPILILWCAAGSVLLFSLFFVQDNMLATVTLHTFWAMLLAGTAVATFQWHGVFARVYRIARWLLTRRTVVD